MFCRPGHFPRGRYAAAHGSQNHVSHLVSTHLRLGILRHLGAVYEDPVLPGEWLLALAVKEARHMPELLGLGYSELPEAVIAQHLAEYVGHIHRRDDVVFERVVIPCKAPEANIQPRPPVKLRLVELVFYKGHRKLHSPVLTIVEEDHGIACLYGCHRLSRIAHYQSRFYEFIGFHDTVRLSSGRLGIADRCVGPLVCRRYGIGRGPCMEALAERQCLVCQPRPVPVAVPVHSVVASHDRSHTSQPELGHLLLKPFEVDVRTSGRRIAAVGEEVNIDMLNLLSFGELKQCIEMTLHRVDTLVLDQTHNMKVGTPGFAVISCSKQGRIGEERSIGYLLLNADDFLLYDSPRTHVEVPYLG